MIYQKMDYWIQRSSSSRPNHSIAEAVDVLRQLSTTENSTGSKRGFNKWFAEFRKKHYRSRNLKAALRAKGFDF